MFGLLARSRSGGNSSLYIVTAIKIARDPTSTRGAGISVSRPARLHRALKRFQGLETDPSLQSTLSFTHGGLGKVWRPQASVLSFAPQRNKRHCLKLNGRRGGVQEAVKERRKESKVS